MLIINADDFGYSTAINAAVLKCFDAGLCSSATLLANMDGFEEACEWIHERNLVDHVGIHINLSEGIPLTGSIRRLPRFCDKEGRFWLLRNERILHFERNECEALAAEIKAQITKLRRYRIKITHLDSHKHVHEEWAVFNAVLPLLKEFQIPFMRIARNTGESNSFLKDRYRAIVNRKLRRMGLSRTQYFGSMKDYETEVTRGNKAEIEKSCEIMIHPFLNKSGELKDAFTKADFMSWPLQNFRLNSPVSFSGYSYNHSVQKIAQASLAAFCVICA